MFVWFVLTGLSLAFVVWDSLINGVTSWVQRLAWILATAYTGPIGVFMYLLGCRRPFPGGHDRYIRATWKQGLNSEMHCLAGDATGIIVAASIVPILGLANGWDVLIEYAAGFVFGLFIFQALMMLGMYGGNYMLAVRKTFFAETVSMNMVMTGMIPVMVILADIWPHSMNPLEPSFWFRMSLASIAGGIIAFPINRWLVANHLKHGCMTLPGADGPAPALGHSALESWGMNDHARGSNAARGIAKQDMPGHTRSQHGTSGQGMTGQASSGQDVRSMGHDMPMAEMAPEHQMSPSQDQKAASEVFDSTGHQLPAGALPEDHPGHKGQGGAHEHHAMAMREPSQKAFFAWIAGTYLVLLLAIWLTSQWVPIRLSGSDDPSIPPTSMPTGPSGYQVASASASVQSGRAPEDEPKPAILSQSEQLGKIAALEADHA